MKQNSPHALRGKPNPSLGKGGKTAKIFLRKPCHTVGKFIFYTIKDNTIKF
jgi:hypothetical protein